MNEQERTHEVERTARGHFLPGQAPKSPGRPRGPSEADKIRALIEPHKAEIIEKAVELAKAGDPQAIKLCLERLAPTPRQEAEKVVVPGLAQAPTLQAKATAILAAVADGQISAEAGDRLLAMLDRYGKAVVLDEHEKRLQAIEGKPRAMVVPLLPDDGSDLV